ncbi:hypothetical protein [Streptomyces gilvosporeus]|uniref:Uncharacterized protein n=1 Tax=Streptomyces gilvosporeus TaxID=553510 RepID=A0A1V0TLL0_9ACTN|nr:hypothetical protein [Streptomyces gilvosporeus]ARF53678.1 hypothetical protein B1H19_05325 [Streptomyces gilvosporeus]
MASTITFDQLLSGAKDFAHLALNAHAEGHTDVFLLEAGVGVERLAKAALVRVHPTLLSEVKGSDDMLLHFAGATTAPPRRFHTIGASTALARLRKMGALPKSEDLDGLIELRNGVAHLGASSAEDYLGTFVDTICRLLDHIGQDRTAFWGAWSDAVQVTLDTKFDLAQKAVHLRMNQARFRFDARFGAMPEGTVESIAKTIGETGLIIIDANRTNTRFRTLSRCPACEVDAAALFLKAVPETTLLYEMELTADGLLCGLCGFHLSDEEEVKIAGLPPTMRCKVEDLTETIEDGPLAAGDLFTHLNSGGLKWFADSF